VLEIQYLINSSVVNLWFYTLLFGVLHSVTAAAGFKLWVYRQGMAVHHYRLLYSTFGLLTTVAWLGLIHALPDMPFYQIGEPWSYVMYGLQLVGIGIAISAFIPIDGAVFLGLKKAEKQVDPFVVRGIYRYIRHPMYAGAMLYLLAKPEQSVVSFHFALAVSLYFILGSKFEEKRMLAENPEYADYQQHVGAFMPKLFK